uniref:Acyclic terpene utilisation N-terminal domain-containing protein n=1 Tax=Hordeum vulgare subsp. vulgare TaxID=112509 RepID=A0A8I6YQ45_HORVV
MEAVAVEEVENCVVKLRRNPQRRKNQVYVGCGAGFGGDRPMAALKLLERVEELNYIVLECLAERTLADRYQVMLSGGKGFDPRVKEWLSMLLPLALDREVCIITNMGAIDPPGAQKEILDLASSLGLEITVAVAYESSTSGPENSVLSNESMGVAEGRSTYLGAAPIVHCLENYKPHVVITSRVADAALFLAPMVYELGWNWDDFEKLAQGTLASHLLECGCQLTGGYFMHPGDAHRGFSFEQLRDLSLPYAEVSYKGEVCVGKAKGSGGLLSYSTCAEQLLYEVGDPANYITPDLVVDFSDVQFHQISQDKVRCKGAKPSDPCRPEKLLQLFPTANGWKGWGEISYGGQECLRRAQAAEYLVRSWLNERYPGIEEKIIAYVMGYDSLKANGGNNDNYSSKEVIDVRLRMDGLFEREEHAGGFIEEFIALYTNGPAGGGGIRYL